MAIIWPRVRTAEIKTLLYFDPAAAAAAAAAAQDIFFENIFSYTKGFTSCGCGCGRGRSRAEY